MTAVYQYCEGGNLQDFLTKRKHEEIQESEDEEEPKNLLQKKEHRYLSEDEILYWFTQIALSIDFMHSKKVVSKNLSTSHIYLCPKEAGKYPEEVEGYILKLGSF